MVFLEGKQTLCSSKLNIDYDDVVAGTNSLFSLRDIEDAMNAGIRKAWDYKLWPFTETIDETISSAGGPASFITIPNGVGLKYQSAFMAIVDGVPWIGEAAGKRNFTDFMKWMSDYPTDNSKIWAEFGDQFYFNANAIANLASFTIDVYGKDLTPLYSSIDDDTFGDDGMLPFTWESGAGDGEGSDNSTDSSGNDAIILFAYAHLLSSEKKQNPNQASIEEKKAYAILDTLWAFIAEGKAQNNPQNRPFFYADDMFSRSNRTTRYDTKIGNFP